MGYKQRSGRPVGTDEDHLMAVIEADRHTTALLLAENTNVSIGAVHNHIKKLELVKNLEVWVPHELRMGNPLDANQRLRLALQTQ